MHFIKNQKGFTVLELISAIALCAVVLFGGGGWIANIVKIVDADFVNITGVLVLRCVGVFMVPLGAVMGYL